MYNATGWFAAPNAVGTGVNTVALSDLTNHPSFQNMFDLYRILSYKVTLVPRFNTSEVSGPPNGSVQAGNLPIVFMAPNTNPSSIAPVSIGDILNDDGCIIHRLDSPVTMTVPAPKPRVITQAGDLVSVQYGRSREFQPWLSTGGAGTLDQTGVAHYGIRWLISNPGPLPVAIDVYVSLEFECKEED